MLQVLLLKKKKKNVKLYPVKGWNLLLPLSAALSPPSKSVVELHVYIYNETIMERIEKRNIDI